MSGAATRSKGRRGQREFADLLRSRDWVVRETNSGSTVEDFIAIDPHGNTWSIEVKNTKAITVAHRQQAQRQADAAKLPWMLASKIAGTRGWLVQRKLQVPAVWCEGGAHG